MKLVKNIVLSIISIISFAEKLKILLAQYEVKNEEIESLQSIVEEIQSFLTVSFCCRFALLLAFHAVAWRAMLKFVFHIYLLIVTI